VRLLGDVHAGVGPVLEVIRREGATTRSALADQLGMSRWMVDVRLEILREHGLVRDLGYRRGSGSGRPPAVVEFNSGAGVILVADFGEGPGRLGLMDLAGTLLSDVEHELPGSGPAGQVLEGVHDRFDALLRDAGRRRDELWGVGLAMPERWQALPIRQWFAERHGVPVVVDTDVAMMARAEHAASMPEGGDLLFVRIGTEIGCGVIAGNGVLRGELGAAGDIAHIPVTGYDDLVCECGNRGCLQAVASGRAIAARLSAAGRGAAGGEDVARLVRDAEPLARRLARDAGRSVGEVLGVCVSLFDPGVIVVGGSLGAGCEPLMSGIRRTIAQRLPPRVRNELRIVPSRLGERAGIIGAGLGARDAVLSVAAIDGAMSRLTPRPHHADGNGGVAALAS